MVDPLRHYAVFQPELFGDRRVDVIGAGATGSRVVMELASLGVQNLHVWDFDKVESHNLANQLYGPEHIGMLKVEALAAEVQRLKKTEIRIHPVEATFKDSFGEVVFLLVDSMRARKELFERAIRPHGTVRLMIETRMGADQGRVYAIDPRVPFHSRGWEGTLYDDSQAERPVCGTSITIGATAAMIAGSAVYQFIRWYKFEQGTAAGGLDHENLFGFEPTTVTANRFL